VIIDRNIFSIFFVKIYACSAEVFEVLELKLNTPAEPVREH